METMISLSIKDFVYVLLVLGGALTTYVGMRVGVMKDVRSLTEKSKEQDARLDDLEADMAETVKAPDCRDYREEKRQETAALTNQIMGALSQMRDEFRQDIRDLHKKLDSFRFGQPS